MVERITEMNMARCVVEAMRILSAPGKSFDVYVDGVEQPEMWREAIQGLLEMFAVENPSLCQDGAEELAEAFEHCINEQRKFEEVHGCVEDNEDLSRWLPSRTCKSHTKE